MDHQLKKILDSMLINLDVLNTDIVRLARSEMFVPNIECLQLILRIRSTCMCSLQNIRTIERGMHKRVTAPQPEMMSMHE